MHCVGLPSVLRRSSQPTEKPRESVAQITDKVYLKCEIGFVFCEK